MPRAIFLLCVLSALHAGPAYGSRAISPRAQAASHLHEIEKGLYVYCSDHPESSIAPLPDVLERYVAPAGSLRLNQVRRDMAARTQKLQLLLGSAVAAATFTAVVIAGRKRGRKRLAAAGVAVVVISCLFVGFLVYGFTPVVFAIFWSPPTEQPYAWLGEFGFAEDLSCRDLSQGATRPRAG